MSVFSAAGFLGAAEADAYTAALLHLVGTQNPLQILRETPAALRSGLERITPSQLDTPEAVGKWSTRFVIGHLADSELVGAVRIRMVLAHDRPSLAPYDQDRWASRLHYDKTDVHEAVERFTVLRKANLALWGDATPAELARVGIHAERGEESLDKMRRIYAGHDLVHLHQLARIRICVTGQ
jgi:hypothetical protein